MGLLIGYVSPDALIPLASLVSAAVGAVLLFGKRLLLWVAGCRHLFRLLRRQ